MNELTKRTAWRSIIEDRREAFSRMHNVVRQGYVRQAETDMKSRRNNTEKGTSYKVSSSAHDLKFKRKSGMKLHFVRHEGRIRRA